MDPNLLLMMAGDDTGSSDLLPLTLVQNLEGDFSENKRMQMLLYIPLAKKMLNRLARRIGRLDRKRREELLAGLVLGEMSKRAEGDMSQLLNLAVTSVVTSIFGGAGVPTLSKGSQAEPEAKVEAEAGKHTAGEVGGTFLGFDEEPRQIAKETELGESVGETRKTLDKTTSTGTGSQREKKEMKMGYVPIK